MEIKDIQGLENLEIEPLSDEDLEAVAGGAAAAGSSNGCCSCKSCSDIEIKRIKDALTPSSSVGLG